MMVRCGACRTQFDVPGAGRFACPVCGSMNVVRGAPSADSRATPPPAGSGAAPPPPRPPDQPSPRVQCPVCDYTFIVGKVAMARCPNCGAEVETGQTTAEE